MKECQLIRASIKPATAPAGAETPNPPSMRRFSRRLPASLIIWREVPAGGNVTSDPKASQAGRLAITLWVMNLLDAIPMGGAGSGAGTRSGLGRADAGMHRQAHPRRLAAGLACALLAVSSGLRPAPASTTSGPFDLLLFATPKAPHATGTAQLVYAHSPFGVAVTTDGRAAYSIRLTLAGLPAPTSLGNYSIYTAWAATPDLSRWIRLGTVANGTTTVGTVDLNKFLLVISAEPSDATTTETGPTVLHGTSPSGYLQSFLGHGLFRIPQQ